ncbi:MAG: 1A family penicillin-binding protein [uncultured bacterium]|nr:MAG: 1A family penicillin-binding protein [uncultured bacterium]HBR71268.1 penicillin-binding protein [Candidatus Moranbacteria bacterium]
MKKENAKTKKRFIIKQTLLGFFDALVVVLIGFSGAVFFLFTTVPSGNLKANWKPAQTTAILDSTGSHILYEVHGEENRKIVSHSEISDNMRKVTIAAEDDSFYSHHGFDVKSMVRALKANLESDHISQGGSTITQQLARNVYLTREKTIKRKIKELLIAVKIERKNTKEDILDYYLNTVPYGANAYGIESAAQIYFGKSAKNLALDESAFLAALPKAPSYYSPYGSNKSDLFLRQQFIIARTADLGLITEEEALSAGKENTFAKVVDFKNKIDAPHFVFYVLDELEKKYGREILEKDGLRVITTLNYDFQKIGEKAVADGVDGKVKMFGGSNAALAAIDPKTGGILTMVGSKDYFDDSIDGQVNVTTRLRQPGSSIKPIIYAAAFEKGYQPETRITDSQTNFGPDGSGRNYIPRNYSGTYRGNVSIRQALAMSLNIPAVKTLNYVGIDDAINMAERLGISTFTDRKNYGLSLAIGGADVTLLQEVGAYSVFANDGLKRTVTSIKEVVDSDGNVIYSMNELKGSRVIDPEISRKISSILSDNEARTPVFGPRNLLHIDGKTVAAKTGTTQDFRDAWTVGYTPSIAVGVWTGNNNSVSMRGGADGSVVAAPIWNNFMRQVIDKIPQESFIAYTPAVKEEIKDIDKPKGEKEIISSLASDVKYKKNLIKDERPKGWSKREWNIYKKSLGL